MALNSTSGSKIGVTIVLVACCVTVVPMVILILNACMGWDDSVLNGLLDKYND